MPYIEKLELKGFKSYGNKKVVIPFSKGFTAIVGANGSGKSNIGDAILFVLGGLSAKAMRASRISDLIFAGSKNEPPAKYAEVAIYFNNEDRGFPIDEDEVVIRRRVYPDGRSSYWLNGRRATRSEILDILTAAMISPDGYNIVLQGDITKFIKMSPLERRLLIDDISGIAEYDSKKEKALEELKQAEENLARVDLLIKEVKKQLDKLEKERNDALRYLDLKDKLEKAKVSLLLGEIKILETQIKEGEKRRAEIEEEIQKIEKEIEKIGKEIVEKVKVLREIEERIEKESGEEAIQITKKIGEVTSKIELTKRNIEVAKEELEDAQRRLAKTKEELRKVLSEIEKSKGAITRWKKRRDALINEIKKKEEERNVLVVKLGEIDKTFGAAREEFDSVVKELEETTRKMYEIEGNIRRLQEEKEKLHSRILFLRAKLPGIKEKINEFKAVVEDKRAEISEIEGKLSTIQAKRIKVEKEIEAKSNELEKVSKELESSERELIAAEAQREVRGNRAAEELKRSGIGGIYGTLAELIKVKDEAYALAIEVALGNRADNVVVEDELVAEKAIKYLKEHKLGRLTFLPLNKIKPKHVDSSVGLPAVDVIEYDQKIENAVKFALGDTVIVNSMEEARPHIGKVRMVTIEGELYERSGAITGGHFRARGLAVDTTKLREKVESLRRRKEALEGELNSLKIELRSLENASFELRIKLSDEKKELELASKDLNRLLEEENAVKEEIEESERKIQEIEQKIENEKSELAKLRGRIQRLERKKEKLKKALENPEARELMEKIRIIDGEISSLKEELSRIESRIESLESRLNEELLPRKASLEEEIEGLVNKINALKNNISENEKALELLNKELEKLKSIEENIKGEIRTLREKRKKLEEDISKLREKKEVLQRKLQELEIEANTLKVRDAQLNAQLEEKKYQLTHYDKNLIKSIKEIPLDLEKVKKEIEKMEEEIRSLEPVNMKAIEDFEIVERRYLELKSKREKLEAEKESIIEFINEIEKEKKNVFMRTFEAISRNFSEIFAKLSPGGSARLILENPEDPFSGGLEIEAKPAGKDVKRIEAMSGGEKALTALAFVFAIQKFKPAPFYLFDEIDAHLDDANVKRVADLIKESSKESQFIVITLRDVMMANADKIIGVSMRDGVSKVVSLSLEKAMKILEEIRKKQGWEHGN
ncbi:chromosome segregation protein SMC [Pyrococcus furiosus DSM 3638]|uniref:Chromosome partition protein Smc n=6 Tax=Pyrococcus furiosus TaxID=2261 RepID=SMC_PYRFU|nr:MULTISPECIES: chromosome segregation protein SMC [Pyrococcus]Q8TZY2.2 RecName: Full=Chromosome partition protein Smc [Pyrococcus furiosus DSM 3638]CAD66602.1 SMC protein [Pyrococcus furiosus]AFN04798.1 chromosome segregation ATPase [Pyrococcus furiosus COM1]MDK2869542.1 chromosome segregation protein [Pyrococcus sp.]QEK79444.1 chromosome segregation protein SMC [Pyrococcus furiosus DSM 3638]